MAEGTYDWGGTNDGVCVTPEKFLKLGALRSPYLYSNLYLDLMPIEYWARVFLECRSPCSGIAEPSLHMFQRRGMVKKVTAPDSFKGEHLKASPYQGGARAPGAPPVPPPMVQSFLSVCVCVVYTVLLPCIANIPFHNVLFCNSYLANCFNERLAP